MDVLKLLTYNIYFDDKDMLKRTNMIIDIILYELPDIIALQEVTPMSYTIIKTNPNIIKTYTINKIHFGEVYGTLILSKLPIEEANFMPYESTRMGRNLEYIIVKINGNDTIIGTTHWESEFSTYKDKTNNEIRKKIRNKISQYIESFMYLNKMKDHHIILMGDTNISDKESNILETPFNYIDVHKTLLLNEIPELAYTYDHKSNKLVKGKYQSRLDRVYYRNHTDKTDWLPISYSLVGRESLKSTGCPPSDHYGVLVEFKV